ncbi:MAG: hypothetical protein JXQ23_00700 [Clostridia bacterium]|nr:hypothetical protein [Clostridia bacterium]
MEKKDALLIFGLDDNSSEKQIKDKYKVFLKMLKNNEVDNIQEITTAYNLLMGYENYDKLDPSSKSFKFRRFLFNYLSYIIIFLGLISLFVILIVPKLTEVKPDLSVSFVGSFFNLESDELEQTLYNNIEGLEKLVIEVIYLDIDTSDGEYDEAGRVKLAGLISTKEADIFIEDDENFVYLSSNEVLMPLDDIIPLLDLNIDESKLIRGRDPADGKIKIYGIDVSTNRKLMTTVYSGVIRIFSIAKETQHLDKALQASKLILEEGN